MSTYNKIDLAFVTRLKRVLGSRVFWCEDAQSKEIIKENSSDQSFHSPAAPEVVVYPNTPEEVAVILKLCNDTKVPVTTRGAGTGVEGGAIPYAGGVVVNTENFQKIDVFPEDMMARVGVGVKKLQLNKEVAKHGLLFGPDPSSNPCLVTPPCSTQKLSESQSLSRKTFRPTWLVHSTQHASCTYMWTLRYKD